MTIWWRSFACKITYLVSLIFMHYVRANQIKELSLCTFEDNTRRGGSDMAGMPVMKGSREDCCAFCLETFGCKAWEYGKLGGSKSGKCWLKYSVPPSDDSTSSIAGIVQDSQKPVVTCPSTIETITIIDMPYIRVTWAFPNATDNSGIVSVTGSHEPGSNFTIGVTTVSYKAEDPSGNTAKCLFSVMVKASLKPLIDDLNATSKNLLLSKVIEGLGELSYAISKLTHVNISVNESRDMAQDILETMDTGITMLQNASIDTETGDQDGQLLIQSVLNATDSLAKFILRYIDPGSGTVVIDTLQFV
ncbi:uncharacterized protein [Ptychodera flava]|uniref:uncharacterized protein n=1 Tax=Ptychodera flava TaxID=63121 RepID=UPI00396A6A98